MTSREFCFKGRKPAPLKRKRKPNEKSRSRPDRSDNCRRNVLFAPLPPPSSPFVFCSDKTNGTNDGTPGTDGLSDPTAETGFSQAVGKFEQLSDSSDAVPNFHGYNYKNVSDRFNFAFVICAGLLAPQRPSFLC